MLDLAAYPPDLAASEAAFFARIQSYAQSAYVYGDAAALAAARSVVPLAELREGAEGDSGALCRALLRWFKLHFFSWVDSLPCESCGGKTEGAGTLAPTPAELAHGGSRVEAHRCTVCGSTSRFPRFNDPVKLLETRRGRCGEWANCFALCAAAAGLDVRLVHDETDHVWLEVWDGAAERWVHADPCEQAWDAPLVYEAGWGKRLTYCLAFSPTEVVDVSWRYSRDHAALRRRRVLCRESRLVLFLHRLRQQKQQALTAPQRLASDLRLVRELAGLTREPREVSSEAETQGRGSGSKEWRAARSELGSGLSQPPLGGALRPTEEELKAGEFLLEYQPSCDEYRRPRAAPKERVVRGWRSSLLAASHVQRKEELDHKMVYLSREQGWAEEGSLVWEVDLRGARERGYEATEATVRLAQTTFHSGQCQVTLCAGDSCALVPSDGAVRLDGLSSADSLTLTARLSQGDWQHAQLCRVSLTALAADPPLSISLNFRPLHQALQQDLQLD